MKKIVLLLTFLASNLYIFSQEPVLSISQPTCPFPYGTVEVTDPVSNPGPLVSNLFISEVTDAATGGLSYIELYNGTGATVNLANYKLKIFSNGSSIASCDMTLSGSLNASNTYVIAVGSTTNLGGVVPNLTFVACAGFNTNDAVTLTTSNNIPIDLWGATDGTIFTPLGQSGYTYRRRTSASVPSFTWNPTDWVALDPEDYTNVGAYSAAVNYLYSVDGGPWQPSPIFNQLYPAIHTIAVLNDTTGDITQSTFAIAPLNITVPVTNFLYPSPFCKNDVLLSPITNSNFTNGGAFTASQGVVIDQFSGTIDLAQTPPGNYIISYLVAPNLALCVNGGSSSFNLIILPSSETPQGSNFQTLTMPNPMLMNLVIAPTTVSWYSSYTNAVNQFDSLSGLTSLVDGATYYAVNNESGCQSSPFPVTVQVALSSDAFTDLSFAVVPNPTQNSFQITSQNIINNLSMYNMLGQEVMTKQLNSTNSNIDLSNFPSGTYILKATSNDLVKAVKIIKN